jgi:hypothetical protein
MLWLPRVLTVLAVVVTAAIAVLAGRGLWWLCGACDGMALTATVALFFLRRHLIRTVR